MKYLSDDLRTTIAIALLTVQAAPVQTAEKLNQLFKTIHPCVRAKIKGMTTDPAKVPDPLRFCLFNPLIANSKVYEIRLSKINVDVIESFVTEQYSTMPPLGELGQMHLNKLVSELNKISTGETVGDFDKRIELAGIFSALFDISNAKAAFAPKTKDADDQDDDKQPPPIPMTRRC